MYGGNNLQTKLNDGSNISLQQVSNYPWDGAVKITITEAPSKALPIHLRIPGWCKKASVKINGKLINGDINGGKYLALNQKWNRNDKIELVLDMPATLIESNPMVEATRNQVAVKRGPVVYCIESPDLKTTRIFDIAIPSDIQLNPVPAKIANGNIMALTGQARLINDGDWTNKLYKEVSKSEKPVNIKLIPYYAWANRGETDMTVWMPLVR
ncbi:hypothetical protein [Niabella ginsengisoli]|uniref:hypothetical protein n=1 Tax=Niabella ginsengisoli TaxID=522298 RepID=UPI00374DAEE7